MSKLRIELATTLRKEYPADPQWRGFVKWWLDANGYDYRGRIDLLVDGCGDGGIDVVARPNPEIGSTEIFVVQSKYFQKSPPLTALKRFMHAASAIRGSRSEFDEWLATVRPELWRTYRNVRSQRRNVRFILLTSARLEEQTARLFRKYEIETFDREKVESLYVSHRNGQTPRVPTITIRAEAPSKLTDTAAHRLWCAKIQLRSLAAAHGRYGDDLFAGNVRYALRGENPSKVREGIRRTVMNSPKEFIYYHNGVTIVSRGVVHEGNRLTLELPSIVNGAQTVSYIGSRLREKVPSNAWVLAKIVEVRPGYSFEQFETDIALSSNTQNKVDFSDLTVAEPSLVEIERGFRRYSCFLERKKGATPGFRPQVKITKERLVQLYAAVDRQRGPTYSKGKQLLFKRDHARELLRQYQASAYGIEDSVCLAKLDAICRSYLTYSSPRTHRRAKLAYFAIFAAFVRALKESGRWNALRKELVHCSNYKSSDFDGYIYSDIRAAAQQMLKKSAAHKKNEPAFYKNKSLVDEAVTTTTRRLTSRVSYNYTL